MRRILFAIFAILVVATAGVYAIFARDLAARACTPRRPQQDGRDDQRRRR